MGRTQTGFPCFARTSCDRGGCPLYSGDSGAHPDRGRSTASICGLSTARSLNPATNIHPCEAPHDEASTKGSRVFTRPIFPSPGAPGWISSTLGFPPSFAPRDYSQRTSGTGQVIEHGPEPTLYLIDLASNHALISQCVRPRVARDDAAVRAAGHYSSWGCERVSRAPGGRDSSAPASHAGQEGRGMVRRDIRHPRSLEPGPRTLSTSMPWIGAQFGTRHERSSLLPQSCVSRLNPSADLVRAQTESADYATD